MSSACEHCGGSGVLNIECAGTLEGAGIEWLSQRYASACHCPMGELWVSVGLEEEEL